MKVTEKIKNRIVEKVRNLTEEELKQEFIYFSIKTGNKLKQNVTPAQNKRDGVVFIHNLEYTEDPVKEIIEDIADYNKLQDCETIEEILNFFKKELFSEANLADDV